MSVLISKVLQMNLLQYTSISNVLFHKMFEIFNIFIAE